MKTLTVKQPWAYLLCSGIKDVENRAWPLPKKYIGERILIHAGKQNSNLLLTDEQAKDAICKINPDTTCLYDAYLSKGNPQRTNSAIIGSVKFVGCEMNHSSVWAEKGVYNWIVEDPILFPSPILNVNGALGFWDSIYNEF